MLGRQRVLLSPELVMTPPLVAAPASSSWLARIASKSPGTAAEFAAGQALFAAGEDVPTEGRWREFGWRDACTAAHAAAQAGIIHPGWEAFRDRMASSGLPLLDLVYLGS
jgi:hypothetical protein